MRPSRRSPNLASPSRDFPAVITLSLLLVLLGGCASSAVQKRIGQNAAFFESLPAETQRRLQAGLIAEGDPAAAVTIALGRPSSLEKSPDGNSAETWIYRNYLPPAKSGEASPGSAPPTGGAAARATGFGGGGPPSDLETHGALRETGRTGPARENSDGVDRRLGTLRVNLDDGHVRSVQFTR